MRRRIECRAIALSVALGLLGAVCATVGSWAQPPAHCPSLPASEQAACFQGEVERLRSLPPPPPGRSAPPPLNCPSLRESERSVCYQAERERQRSLPENSSAVRPASSPLNCPSLAE